MKLEELKNKKVLILGFGKEGRDSFNFLRKNFPKKVLGVADEKKLRVNKKVKLHLGKNYLKAMKNYEVIIKSPGIPPKAIAPFIRKSQTRASAKCENERSSLLRITSQADIFFENCPGRIVGITGTKGKSTTASMIYKILKEGGVKAHLVGNIGKPALSSLEKTKRADVFIYELSSHQLYNLKESPYIAVLLNIYPEHLDYYRSFMEYAKAKANITLHQNKDDFLVFNSEDKLIREFAKKSKARKIPIRGKYYSLNKEAAKEIGKIFKIPLKTINRVLKNFKYLAHRLEKVGTFQGITFYNDALATIPEATMGAMEALGNRVETIMLGGYERKIDYKKLAQKIQQSEIKNVILFPTTGKRIWKEICRQGRKAPKHFFVGNMTEAVKLAYRHTKPGKICLLSTAASSFSIFKDYREKGNLFKKYVKRFARNPALLKKAGLKFYDKKT